MYHFIGVNKKRSYYSVYSKGSISFGKVFPSLVYINKIKAEELHYPMVTSVEKIPRIGNNYLVENSGM